MPALQEHRGRSAKAICRRLRMVSTLWIVILKSEPAGCRRYKSIAAVPQGRIAITSSHLLARGLHPIPSSDIPWWYCAQRASVIALLARGVKN